MNSKVKSTIQNLPNFLKYLLILGVVAFISLLFPNNVKFQYEFQEGQTWSYDKLEAPFDFAIRRTAAEIKAAKDQINADFSPYYQMDLSIVRLKKSQFLAAFDQQLAAESENSQFEEIFQQPQLYKKYGIRLLDKYYNQGIIAGEHPYKNKGADFVVNIIKGNTEYRQTLQNILDKQAVLNLVIDSFPNAPLKESEFILPLIETAFQPNLFYSDTLSKKFKQSQLDNISTTQGYVKKGELIVNRDGIVTDNIFQKLLSFKTQYELDVSKNKTHLAVFVGYFFLTSLIIGVLLLFLRLKARAIFDKFPQLLFILMWIVLYSYLVYLVESFDDLTAWVIPFCIVPIVIKSFYNDQIALFIHITIVLIASFLSSLGYEFTFIQILAGIVALLTTKEIKWSNFFWSLFYIFLTIGIGYFSLSLIKEGNIYAISWKNYPSLFLSVILTLLAFPLIPLIERVFGFTSSIRLSELAELNRPLLKKLSLEAPGTLQHSLQVANLAEAAATKIGADALLVKVGALYHDIGKTIQPIYYIENQNGHNPHDQLSEVESAKIIIDHVKEGVELAKKYRLPKILIDFITTHHGTTRTEYFYRNFLKNNPDIPVVLSDFCYPGPKPTTKEQTILLLADSVEAASKSLKNPKLQEISDLVDNIISYKITHEQLTESDLTFEELESCRSVFKQLLKSMLHVRMEYPDEIKKKE